MSRLWLRAEDNQEERRSPLTPEDAGFLVMEGHEVLVEDSPNRVFSSHEYEKVGCRIVELNDWREAPRNALVLGLKQFHLLETPLHHRHIYFSHALNGQYHSEYFLKKILNDGGCLYDLEYFCEKNKRIASFGFHAGVVAATMAIKAYSEIKQADISTSFPQIAIMGGNGRCGQGARSVLDRLGIPYLIIDRNMMHDLEAARMKILDSVILFNCISSDAETPVILRSEDMASVRSLLLIVDVACDINSPYNPLKIYKNKTTFSKPIENIFSFENPCWIISIDNYASLMPLEASSQFSKAMLSYYRYLLNDVSCEAIDNAVRVYYSAVERLK